MQVTLKSSLFILTFVLSGCVKHEVVINHFQDSVSGDTAEVRIIGFTQDSHLWDGFDCSEPYKMPPKGYYPHIRQTFEDKPAYIDKGFKKSPLPKNKYPLDMAEFNVRSGKLLTFWGSNHLSDGRLCQKTITIRPEKNKLYEFRNWHNQSMCYFELYEINRTTGVATQMKPTDYSDMCHK